MTAYAFATGRVEGDTDYKAAMTDVSLDFVEQPDGLRIIGKCKDIEVPPNLPLGRVQIYFVTTTSNFGVSSKEVTIKLNSCSLNGNEFEALPDEAGNVFTLSMSEDAA